MAVSVSGIIYRLVKDSPLTLAEGDGNLRILANAINALDVLFGVVLNPNGTLKDNAVNRPDILADGVVTQEKLSAGAKIPAGLVLDFAGSAVPAGWLECDGSTIPRVAPYHELFLAIGETWGAGNGDTTFTLPDLRGRCRIGVGLGPGLSNRILGKDGLVGNESVSLIMAHLPAAPLGLSSPHYIADANNYTDLNGGTVDTGAGVGNFTDGSSQTAQRKKVRFTTDNLGTSLAHNNIQPSAALRAIIKY